MRVKDISGQRFGRLLVVSRAPNSVSKGRPSGRVMWNCICDCGKKKETYALNLLSGNCRSCGCVRIERVRQMGVARRITDPQKIEESRRRTVRGQFKRLLERKYGLTIEKYEAQVKAQDGKCSICGRIPEKRLAVDHCHISGRIRGLLCYACNSAIGLMGDDPDMIRRASAYVEGRKNFYEFV